MGLAAAASRAVRRALSRGRFLVHRNGTTDLASNAERGYGFHVDAALRPDRDVVFLAGWLFDPGSLVERVVLRAGRESIEPGLSWFERPDVRERYGDAGARPSGFASMVDLPAPVDLAAPFLVELRLRSGKVQYVRVPAQESPCPYAVRSTLLDLLPYASGSEGSLVELHRALVRTLERCARERRVVADWWIGEAPASPEVSVIVPLFGELDLLESQLTEFAKDAEWRARAELIYVLDEPDRTQHLERLSRELHAIYGVPARFIALAENGGFGAATNEGARHARGELLVLLNSDVVPDEPGWIGASVDAFRAQPGIGVLGPKLLYEDGSLQHAGIFFAPNRVRIHDGSGRPVDIDIWKNHQFYKGYPGTLPEANIARDVPAVSAACMMTPRALFHELGGLDESYVLGDCEDSDYCLRVAERGLRVRYEPRFALYHLEGQSYPDRSRRLVSVFNNWQQDRRWRAAMTARMTAFERATAGTGGPP